MSGVKVSQDDASSKRKGLDPDRLAAVREAISRSGLNMTDWARRRGFSIRLVHEILSGRRSCVRGESYRIAILLGLKDGDLPDIDQRVGGSPTPKNKT